MRTHARLAVTGLLVLAACGGEAPESAAGATADEASTTTRADVESPAETSSPESGTDVATSTQPSSSTGPCAEARVDGTETFDEEDLSFHFDHPSGWDHMARAAEGYRGGSLAYVGPTGRRSSTGMIQYVYETEPTTGVGIARQMLERTGEPISSLQIDGRDVTVYGMADEAVVDAKLLFPEPDGVHLLSLTFGSASDDCVAERERIRDLVLETLRSRS